MWVRISSGSSAMGHLGCAERLVSGSTASIRRVENSSTSCLRDAPNASERREWWSVRGTVAGALDGLGLDGFDLAKTEGGKCLRL